MALHVIDMGPAGALIQVGVRVGAAFEASGRGGAPGSYNALIDTRASTTAISPKVVADVQPQRLGSTTLRRVGAAPLTITRYDVGLKFESHLMPGRWFDLKAI
jgi:hypothetical protein